MKSAAALVEVGRTASDEEVTYAASEHAIAASRVGHWKSEQVGTAPRPPMQAPPPLWLAEASEAVRADLEPTPRGGPQHNAPQQEHRGDRRGRVQETRCDALRGDGAGSSATSAAVASQPHRSPNGVFTHVEGSPQASLASTMPVQLKTALVMGRRPTPRAVARARCLDAGVVFRPRLDVEGEEDQGRGCFGHSMADRSNRDDELPASFARRSSLVGGQDWRGVGRCPGSTSLPLLVLASNFLTLDDLDQWLPGGFGIIRRERVDARWEHLAQALTVRPRAPGRLPTKGETRLALPFALEPQASVLAKIST